MAYPRGYSSIYAQVGLQDPLKGDLTSAFDGQVITGGTPITHPVKILSAYSTDLLSGFDAPIDLLTDGRFDPYHGVGFVYGHRGSASPLANKLMMVRRDFLLGMLEDCVVDASAICVVIGPVCVPTWDHLVTEVARAPDSTFVAVPAVSTNNSQKSASTHTQPLPSPFVK